MASVRIEGPQRRLSPRDASFLYLERPHSPLHIACIAIVDGPVSRTALAARIESRLVRMSRYAQRAVPAPLRVDHPSWEDDPDFDPYQHVQRWTLPTPGGEAELLDVVEALLIRSLDRSRPLWEMHVLEGLPDGRTAVIQKVHHCMVDGVAGAQLLEVLLDRSSDAREGPPVVTRFEPPSPRSRLYWALADGLRRQGRATAAALAPLVWPTARRAAAAHLRQAASSVISIAVRRPAALPWNGPIGRRRSLAFTRLPMDGVRCVRAAQGGTVNDVVLSTIAGALHRYLEANGTPTKDLELTALVPVSLRDPHQRNALGNRISAMLLPLAVGPHEEIERLAATRAASDRLKASAAWEGIDWLLGLVDFTPPPLLELIGRRLGFAGVANLIATNVRGPAETRYLCGARVEALHPVVPIADGLGLGVAVFSYAGWLHVGLHADADCLPDVEKLRQGFEEAFRELVASSQEAPIPRDGLAPLCE